MNGQLELNYCLALALSNYNNSRNILIEPDWILSTKYNNDRKGTLRKLVNSNVLQNVVLPVSGLAISKYYHIILTSDKINPLLDNAVLPEILNENNNDIWYAYKSQFGWINFDKLLKIAENNFSDNLFLETYRFNEPNLFGVSGKKENCISQSDADKSRGCKLIYAPEITAETFLHFSYCGESCVLRNYSNNNYSQISNYITSDVEKVIEKEISLPKKRPPVSNVSEWNEIIRKLNSDKLTVE